MLKELDVLCPEDEKHDKQQDCHRLRRKQVLFWMKCRKKLSQKLPVMDCLF